MHNQWKLSKIQLKIIPFWKFVKPLTDGVVKLSSKLLNKAEISEFLIKRRRQRAQRYRNMCWITKDKAVKIVNKRKIIYQESNKNAPCSCPATHVSRTRRTPSRIILTWVLYWCTSSWGAYHCLNYPECRLKVSPAQYMDAAGIYYTGPGMFKFGLGASEDRNVFFCQ